MNTKEGAWTDENTATCKRIWEEYQRQHDLSDRKGQTAGIDPESGDVWLGNSIVEIVDERRKAGLDSPLFFERIGYPAYFRTSGRR